MAATDSESPDTDPIRKQYGALYSRKNPDRVYPVEFVVRTMLGTYPRLHIDRGTYPGSRILDLGFGDGRNIPLLADLGFEVCGVEISDEICRLTRERMKRLGYEADLRTGSNSHIPFPDAAFDFVLACHACYYVAEGETFSDNLREIVRILRPGGRFIFSLAKSDSYIFDEADQLLEGHYRVAHDPCGVREGTILRAFTTRDEVEETIGRWFDDLCLGVCENDFYGIYEKVWIGTGVCRP